MTNDQIQTIFIGITAIVATASLILSIKVKSLTDVVEVLTSQTKELIRSNDHREQLFYKSIMPNFVVYQSGHEQTPVEIGVYKNTGNFIISLRNIGEFCKTLDIKIKEPSSSLIALVSTGKNVKPDDMISINVKRETQDTNDLTIGNFNLDLQFSDRFGNSYIQILTKEIGGTRLSPPKIIP